MQAYHSWGRYPVLKDAIIKPILWLEDIPDLNSFDHSVLAYAHGRSYGDSCLNEGNVMLITSHLNRLIAFDERAGLLRCEAGTTLAEILDVIVPRYWFLPVSPGTKYVSVAGAVANDVHGKNHHRCGTFGRYVTQFELVRSSGERLICSPTENEALFRATIGGLGLTGLITWVEFQLKRIPGPLIESEHIRFDNLDEFFQLSTESDTDFEYTVAWLDCIARGPRQGRGIYMRGNHTERASDQHASNDPLVTVPFNLPGVMLNRASMGLFNTAFFHKQQQKRICHVGLYDPFFYPLDVVGHWTRLYGKRGFLQYQFVVPHDEGAETFRDILTRITNSGEASFLVVLKKFGDIPSPGMMSFPKPGITLALDLPFHGKKTLALLDELDAIVRACNGAVYPAKDARMSAESFQTYFPQWQSFAQYIDPKFSSSFWRRVTTPSTREHR